jgi:hypothetical protein
VRALVAGGLGISDIGVISPYNAQVDLIQQKAADEALCPLEVHTVDKYQVSSHCIFYTILNEVPELAHSLGNRKRRW